jgi:rod shape-determining protein MreC
VYQRRRARILLAVLVLAALALVTVDFRTGDEGPVDRLRGGLTAVMRPVQDGLAMLVRPVGEAAGNVTEIFRVRAENERLRAQLEVLQERRRSAADLERENEELRALLDMRDRGGFETIAATTVALAPSTFEWTITIDVGSEHGVERDMPVINADGLVGRVIQVTPRASRVLLAIDPNFSAAARTARSGEVGPLDGRGGDPMVFRPFAPGADVAPGDEIVTAPYRGGVFPGGIPIGTVASIGASPSPLLNEVEVRPFVDFTRLHTVLVVISAPIEEVPPLTDMPELEFVPPDVPPRREPDRVTPDDDGDDPPDDAEDVGDGEGAEA